MTPCTSQDKLHNDKPLIHNHVNDMGKTTPKEQPARGLRRIINATFYSFAGLKDAVLHETSFRQELLASLFMLPLLIWLPVTSYLKWMIVFAHLLVLITELLNSAIEAVVDLASPEYHLLAKRAKDLGSAAVLLTLLPTSLLWCYVIFLAFFNG